MLTPENIVASIASIHSASKLLIFATSCRKTILNRFSQSSANWAKEEYIKGILEVSLCVGYDLFFRSVSRQVFSALQSLTSVFGMGTGGPFALKTLTYELYVHRKPNKVNEGRNKTQVIKIVLNLLSSSPRSISIGQLNTLLCVHLRPIKLVVYE